MKEQTETNISKISRKKKKNLTTIIVETIATDFIAVKRFNIVDLWNIQKRRKTSESSGYHQPTF